MIKKRRRHTATCKFRLALEALEGSKSIRTRRSGPSTRPTQWCPAQEMSLGSLTFV